MSSDPPFFFHCFKGYPQILDFNLGVPRKIYQSSGILARRAAAKRPKNPNFKKFCVKPLTQKPKMVIAPILVA